MKQIKLVIVGSVAHDTYSTPHGKVEKILGGSAVHASVSASYFVQPVGLVGVIGEDFSNRNIRFLKSKNVDIGGLSKAKGSTFHWVGKYEGDMSVAHTLETHLGVFASFNPELPHSYKQADYIFLANIDPVIQLKVLKQARKPKFVLLDTMNFWILGKKKALVKVISKVDAVILNDQEIRLLTGKFSILEAAKAIIKLGTKFVIVKKGEHGALLFGKNFMFQIGAFPVDRVKDPTGAGDTFAGGFIGSLAKYDSVTSDNLRKSMAFGTCMASFNVEEFSLRGVHKLDISNISERVSLLKEISFF